MVGKKDWLDLLLRTTASPEIIDMNSQNPFLANVLILYP